MRSLKLATLWIIKAFSLVKPLDLGFWVVLDSKLESWSHFPSFDLVSVRVMLWTCMTKIYEFNSPLGEEGTPVMSHEMTKWNKSLKLKVSHVVLTTWGLSHHVVRMVSFQIILSRLPHDVIRVVVMSWWQLQSGLGELIGWVDSLSRDRVKLMLTTWPWDVHDMRSSCWCLDHGLETILKHLGLWFI